MSTLLLFSHMSVPGVEKGVVTAVACRGQHNFTRVSKLRRLGSEVREDLLDLRVLAKIADNDEKITLTLCDFVCG